MLGIVVSRADSASVHIGEQLRAVCEWEKRTDDSRPDADGGGTIYCRDGVCIREFDQRHLDMERPADAFDDPTLVVFASRHAGKTGPLLTAHHTGNAGPADHGGRANELARACPNAHARVLDSLAEHAPEDYEVGMECTHHGPSRVGAPSMFVEVGSDEPQWTDPAAARAVARAILDLQAVPPDRSDGRHLVGFGGGHYTPRFERIARETDWAVGHVVADWGLTALESATESPSERKAVLEAALEQSRARFALVDGDHPAVTDFLADSDYRSVSETWVRETAAVPLALATAVEAAVGRVDDGLRFGDHARNRDGDATPPAATSGDQSLPDDWETTVLPGQLLDEAFGIDPDATRAAVAGASIAFQTVEGGTRPVGRVVLPGRDYLDAILEAVLDILEQRYDTVERRDVEVLARVEEFSPERASTLGVPEGPAFGRLADGEAVEVDGRTIPPGEVREERERRFSLSPEME